MNNKEVAELIDRFAASGLAHMKVQMGGASVELDRFSVTAAGPSAAAACQEAPGYATAPSVAAAQSAMVAPESTQAAPTVSAQDPCITAPLVGTFYASPAPDKAPYVSVGDHVAAGQTVCLLEAMKMMSEVTAPCDCVIEEILVADGELVSFEAPLIRYRTA